MGENSKIEWCHHTFNPWIGCTRVSPGCKHCYAADMMDKRYKRVKWGPGQPRVRTSESNWRKPRKWNREAEQQGIRYRVFCSSLADVFDPEVDPEWRHDLFRLIGETPHLDWLLLTKRPEAAFDFIGGESGAGLPFFAEHYPNVWLGTSVENQEQAEKRVPVLLRIPAAKHFLSCEPLLGPVNLRRIELHEHDDNYGATLDALCGVVDWVEIHYWFEDHSYKSRPSYIDWVIVGGESGPGARPMNPDWVKDIRDDCQECGTGCAFFFKQWGEWVPELQNPGALSSRTAETALYVAPDGTTRPAKFGARADSWTVQKVGKGKAGRRLDGRTWDEVP